MRRAVTGGLLAVVVLVGVVVAGCSDEDGGSANGPCGSNGQCPVGFTCETRLDLCLATTAADGGTIVDARTGADATVGPVTTITPGFDAGAPSNAASVSFAFQAQIAGATFECKVDGGAFATCTSPLSLAPAEGTHMLTVRASAGGLVEANPPTVTFIIDRTAPVFTLGAVDENSSAGTMTIHYAVAPAGDASGLDFTECALDGVACACGASSAVCAEVAAGEHIFSVAARDAAGNPGPTATSASPSIMTYGPNAGRVVLIGHDFTETSAPARDVLAGALAEVPFALESLGFARTVRLATFRSVTADDAEVTNALDAVRGLYDTNSVGVITGTTEDALKVGLRSRDVLLVFDQNDEGTSRSAGGTWSSALHAFVDAGGVVVVLDGLTGGKPSNTFLVLSDLLDISRADAIEAEFADNVTKVLTATEVVNGDTSPLAPAGAATQYTAPAGTVVFTESAPTQRWIYERDGEVCGDGCFPIFNPIVLEKIYPSYTVDPTFAENGYDGFSASPNVAISVATTPAGVAASRFDCSYLVQSCQLATCQGHCPTDGNGNFRTPSAPADYDLELRLIDPHGGPGTAFAASLRIAPLSISEYNPQLTSIHCIENTTLPPRNMTYTLVETVNGVPVSLGTTVPPDPSCSVGNVVFSFVYQCQSIGNPVWTVTATDEGGNVTSLSFCDR